MVSTYSERAVFMTRHHRVIMRIEVASGTPEAIDIAVHKYGSTHVSIFSRLVEWVVKQDEDTQAAILGVAGADARVELTAKLLGAHIPGKHSGHHNSGHHLRH